MLPSTAVRKDVGDSRVGNRAASEVYQGMTMSTSFAGMLLPLIAMVGAIWLACAVLGLHALILGRMPGRWLQRHVRQPRLWGAGALFVAWSGFEHPSFLVVGIGLIALGHVVKPAS